MSPIDHGVNRRKFIYTVLALALAFGGYLAFVMVRSSFQEAEWRKAHARVQTTSVSPDVILRAKDRLAAIAKLPMAGGVAAVPCPNRGSDELVPTIELDDLQGRSSDWHFLVDDRIEHLLGSDTERSYGEAAQQLADAKHLLVFVADDKALPEVDAHASSFRPGRFSGQAVLVGLQPAPAIECVAPLVVSHTTKELKVQMASYQSLESKKAKEAVERDFRRAFFKEAEVAARALGIRVSLLGCLRD